jgi:Tfp pilus assembly protein PilN
MSDEVITNGVDRFEQMERANRETWQRLLAELLEVIPDGIKTQRVKYRNIEIGIRVIEPLEPK